MERVRMGARSAARDLLRLVRALAARGVDLHALPVEQRAALEAVSLELRGALSPGKLPDDRLEAAESSIADTRALLVSTRRAILDRLGRVHRLGVLEAMLRVEVADEELKLPRRRAPEDRGVAASRRRARKLAAMRRLGEKRRRAVELQAIDVDAPLRELLVGLPPPWFQAACTAAGLLGARAPGGDDIEELARLFAERGFVHAKVGRLLPGERRALGALLRAEGIMLASVFERRFGDVSEDGFDWDREPPTSILGRLRREGLCFVGRAPVGPSPRSRPRVVLVPRDLRRVLAQTHRALPVRRIDDRRVPAGVVEERALPRDVEVDAVQFERAQPDLARFAAAIAPSMSAEVGGGALLYQVGMIWAMFDAAFPGRTPRLRAPDLERARRASRRDLEAMDIMHERLLERRVGTMISCQPNVYAYLATTIEEMAWSEEDKLRVFHTCDTALRALDASLA